MSRRMPEHINRALTMKDITLAKWALENGYPEGTVRDALVGRTKGPRSQEIRAHFIAEFKVQLEPAHG